MHNIYFTRHGETVWNVENKICGMTDSPLTARGQEQARQLGALVRDSDLHIDEILYSPSPAPPTPQRPLPPPPVCPPAASPACGSSALANTRARPGTVRSSASPRPTLPTAMTAAKA